jgi:hypothetical protein
MMLDYISSPKIDVLFEDLLCELNHAEPMEAVILTT